MSYVQSLDGVDLIEYLKKSASTIPAHAAPTIFKRLGSLNNIMAPAGVTLKMENYYYYLVENITEFDIGCYISLSSDLKAPFVLDLMAIAYTFPDKSLFSYPNQSGFSSIVQSNYQNADSTAFEKDQKSFEPFAPENYNGDFNQFIDKFTHLTSFVNEPSSNKKKLYTVLLYAKSTRELAFAGKDNK